MASARLYHDVVGFARTLRGAGLPVGVEQSETFAEALARVNTVSPRDVYLAARATLVMRREDLPVFDDLFAAFFGAAGEDRPRAAGPARAASRSLGLLPHRARRVHGRAGEPARPRGRGPRADPGGESARAPPAQGLRRVHARGARRARAGAARRPVRPDGPRVAPSDRGTPGRPPRHAARAAQRGEPRRHRARAPSPAPQAQAPPAGRPRRHQRLDGALLPHPPAVPPRHRAPPRAHRDVRLRHPAHAHHEPAPDSRRRHRARPRRARDRGLRRRHAHRRVPADVQSPARPARAPGAARCCS